MKRKITTIIGILVTISIVGCQSQPTNKSKVSQREFDAEVQQLHL